MIEVLDKFGIVTVLMSTAFILLVVVGGIVTISNPDTLDFEKYLTLIVGASGALGLLGVGRGIYKAGVTSPPPPPQP